MLSEGKRDILLEKRIKVQEIKLKRELSAKRVEEHKKMTREVNRAERIKQAESNKQILNFCTKIAILEKAKLNFDPEMVKSIDKSQRLVGIQKMIVDTKNNRQN